MKKIIYTILGILLIVIIASYFIPATQQDFFENYKKDDVASKTLKEFLQRPVKTCTTDKINWNYVVSGKSEKTILFCHGMGGASELWWQQVNAFEKNFKVITYTLPEEINTISAASKGILAILDKENIDSFSVVGTSMGGYITQSIMHQVPNRIEKVVLSNTFAPNDLQRTKNKTKSKILPLLPEIVISKLGNKQLQNKLIPAGKNSELLAAFLPSLAFSKKQFMNRYAVIIDSFEINPNSPEIKTIPKLIIESDNDPLVEKELREQLKKQYLDAGVYTFHDEGHFPYINIASTYNQVLIDFISEPIYEETVSHE